MGDKAEELYTIHPKEEKDQVEEEGEQKEVEERLPSPPHDEEAAMTKGFNTNNLRIEENPSKPEVIGWYLYEFCSYFIVTTLIPIIFPLIISQTVDVPTNGVPVHGVSCTDKELHLYWGVASRSIHVDTWRLSPLTWVSASWALGLLAAAPLLSFISRHLDYGQTQPLIAGAATLVGAIFCLPAGSLRKKEIFPPYIAMIIIAHTVAMASHTRNLGMMVRGFVGPTVEKAQFRIRTGISAWLSLMSAAWGCIGSAVIASFAYGMLVHGDMFISLWVVSIFSGIIWLVGAVHVATAQRPGQLYSTISTKVPHIFSVFSFPHGIGALFGVLLGSFTSMCVFAGSILYVVSHCVEPEHLLHYWLVYFGFSLLALPMLHPLQQALRANSVKMQIMGFALSTFVSGVGFYYRKNNWSNRHVLIFAAVQGVSTGISYAYGRVVTMDCAPVGKEGAFAAWHSWVRGAGSSIGFAVAVANPGEVTTSFGVAFCIGITGIVALIYGNVSDISGAEAAGHVKEMDGKRLSAEYALEDTKKSTEGTLRTFPI